MLHKCPEPPRERGQEGEAHPVAGQVPGNCLETEGGASHTARFSFLQFQACVSRKRCSQGSLAEVLLAALWQP